jgi:Domain of Unknown Function (DUF928)
MFRSLRWKNIYRFILIFVILVFLLGTTSPMAFAQPFHGNLPHLIAQTNSGNSQSSSGNPITEIIRRVQSLLNPSSQRGAKLAGRARGGAGRGRLCPSTPLPVAAFVPALKPALAESSNQVAVLIAPETVFGKTIAANPTFWFYVPYAAEAGVKTASFMLLDADTHPVLPEPILIEFSDTPGVIEFQLPYALEVDRLYNWYFSILCDPLKPSRNAGVRGWIQQVSPSPDLQTALAADADRPYRAYLEQGLWFEAVTDLAKRYRGDRATYQQDWAGLLDFMERPDLKAAAIVECCKPNS